MFLVYKNRFNEVKAYSVEIIASDGNYLDVRDLKAGRIKTFKHENILSEENSIESAQLKAESLQSNFNIIQRSVSTGKRMPSRDGWNNKEGKFEVCFTGFKKVLRDELENYARENDLFIRSSVTQKLGLLVCGGNAGPSKIQKANKLNVPRVVGEDGFYNFLETGEFAE